MKEKWKNIPDYEGLYEVSNLGRVRSCDRIVKCSDGREWCLKGRILKPEFNGRGYLRISLWKNGKQKAKRVNRLVAQMFIPNPNGLSQVNHIDENKTNNCVSNLEWCSAGYNVNFGSRNERSAKAHSKQVLQFTLDGQLIKRWSSAIEAARQTGFSQGHISECCRGEHKTAYGHIWRYSNAEN